MIPFDNFPFVWYISAGTKSNSNLARNKLIPGSSTSAISSSSLHNAIFRSKSVSPNSVISRTHFIVMEQTKWHFERRPILTVEQKSTDIAIQLRQSVFDLQHKCVGGMQQDLPVRSVPSQTIFLEKQFQIVRRTFGQIFNFELKAIQHERHVWRRHLHRALFASPFGRIIQWIVRHQFGRLASWTQQWAGVGAALGRISASLTDAIEAFTLTQMSAARQCAMQRLAIRDGNCFAFLDINWTEVKRSVD